MKHFAIVSLALLMYMPNAFCQSPALNKSGVGSLNIYFSRLKAYSESIVYDVVTGENMLADQEDTSEGRSTRSKAVQMVIQTDRDRNLIGIYVQLKGAVDGFITGLEADFISKNSVQLKDTARYNLQLHEIDNLFNLLQAAKIGFDHNFKNHVRSTESASGATPFTLTSLIPDPLTLFTDITSFFQNKRDFRAQQVQSINTILETFKLSAVADITSGSGSSGSGSGSGNSPSSGKAGNKKGK